MNYKIIITDAYKKRVKKFLKKMHYDLLQIGKKLGVKETSEKRKTGIKGIKEKIKKKR